MNNVPQSVKLWREVYTLLIQEQVYLLLSWFTPKKVCVSASDCAPRERKQFTVTLPDGLLLCVCKMHSSHRRSAFAMIYFCKENI